MDCEQALHQLPAYVDHALPPEQAEDVGAHLDVCARCCREAELYQTVEEILLAEPVQPVPAGFADRVLQRLDLAPGSAPASQGERNRAALAAAVAAALAAVLVLLLPGGSLWEAVRLGRAWLLKSLTQGLESARALVDASPGWATQPLAMAGAGVLLALALTLLRLRVEPELTRKR